MATAVSTIEIIELQDGTVVELRPLNIKNLRRFMEKINEFVSLPTNEKYLKENKEIDVPKLEEDSQNVLLDAAAICINNRKQHQDLVEDRDKLEDALDMPTIFRILKVCGDVDLDPANLRKKAADGAKE